VTHPTSYPDFGPYGVWKFGGFSPEEAAGIEALGFGAVWIAGSPAADLTWVEPLLASTTTLHVVSAVVDIWTGEPEMVAESFHRVEEAHPGRFLLGIGAGHPERHQQWKKPIAALVDYLDRLDACGVPKDRRILAALGPKALTLAAERTVGAHPGLTTPQHTSQARTLMGPAAFLAPEQKVVLSTDVEEARRLGRGSIAQYLNLENGVGHLKRLGFGDDDVAVPGSDRLVDAVVAYGSADVIATKLNEHVKAGANHVPLQVVDRPERLLPVLTELAGALGVR
jgi:probable F420-dependent oxidoreductase